MHWLLKCRLLCQFGGRVASHFILLSIVHGAGTDFAFPSQTTYISRDSGLDRERGSAAEAQVQSWRSKGVLPFPEVPSEQRKQLRDTLDFPPEGSPDARPASGNGNNDH